MTTGARLRTRRAVAGALAAAAVVVWAARPAAHDIPADLLVRVFVKPEAARLRLLVRVPLAAMRDVAFPTRGPGYLDLARAGPFLDTAARLWIVQSVAIAEHGVPLEPAGLAAIRVSLPSDRSFASWDEALAHVTGPPLPDDTDLLWNQALLDVLLEYPIASDRGEFAIHPAFARLGLRVVTVLRFLPAGGAERAFEYAGDPGLVTLDPRWHQAALQFVRLGFEHILEGTDHLLFLLCLVIPFRRFRPLVLIVTAFTVAHSITLLAAASGFAPDRLWFPPLIEALIAASIVYMALENVVGVTAVRRRWAVAFAFGLVHGFGFAFALRDSLQFAGGHLVTSLVSFNVGVELGQLLALAVLVPALWLLFRKVVDERLGTIILSAIVAHTAWHWMADRGGVLAGFAWTRPDAATVASALRWLMALVAAAAAAWLLAAARRPRAARPDEGPSPP